MQRTCQEYDANDGAISTTTKTKTMMIIILMIMVMMRNMIVMIILFKNKVAWSVATILSALESKISICVSIVVIKFVVTIVRL